MEASLKFLLERKQGPKSSKMVYAWSLPAGLQQQRLQETLSLQGKQAGDLLLAWECEYAHGEPRIKEGCWSPKVQSQLRSLPVRG